MPNYMAPGIYVEEVSGGARPIQAVGTSTCGFVGVAPDPAKHVNEAVAINNWAQFVREFCADDSPSTPLSNAVYGFFLNGGSRCYVVNVGKDKPITGGGKDRQGLDLLAEIDEIAIVAIPGYHDAASYEAALSHCEILKDRVAILDAPDNVKDIDLLLKVATAPPTPKKPGDAGGAAPAGGAGVAAADNGLRPRQSEYGTFYFPWIKIRDPLSNELVSVPPSGHMAGIWARSDATRGVHKAPANEAVRGALNVDYNLTRDEQGNLNQNGINCIRLFQREGIRVWGARTLADGEWKYLNVRRLFNMVEESIASSTHWIVFEPNDRTLWKSIRRDISAFLTILWRDGALMGRTPEEAFFVKCDEETNPPEIIDAGMVVTIIGIAPVKPAEFIIFRVSQFAGGAKVEAQEEPMPSVGTFVDPYRAYNFKLEIQGVTQGHFTECRGMGIRVHPIKYREGGNNQVVHNVPGPVEYGDVTLHYGLTSSTELWDWFMTAVAGRADRKNVSILLVDSDGSTEVARSNLVNAWPSQWQGSVLNATIHEVAIETLTLVFDTLERG